MSYTIVIRRNSDGLVRRYMDDCDWDEGPEGSSLWLWTEGNYSCDCNRALFFKRAENEPDDDDDTDCGDTAYTVLWAELPDGSLRHIDDFIIGKAIDA